MNTAPWPLQECVVNVLQLFANDVAFLSSAAISHPFSLFAHRDASRHANSSFHVRSFRSQRGLLVHFGNLVGAACDIPDCQVLRFTIQLPSSLRTRPCQQYLFVESLMCSLR